MSVHLPVIRQGDDYTFEFYYPAGTDTTGFKFYLTLKSSFDDPDSAAVMQHLKVAGDNPLDDVINGALVFTVPAPVTAIIPKGSYYYDFQAIDATSHVTTILPPLDDYKFKLQVIPQVTRAVT